MTDASIGRPRLVVVAGPTASGKTGYAIELARALDAEIVSADSMQVYKNLDIGTAKPTADERAQVPHHLIDYVEPDEPYSVARYLEDADRAISEIASRGKKIVLCGGTALYIKVLIEGLMEGPGRDEAVRAELETKWEEGQGDARGELWQELKSCDPETAERLHPNDRSRIIRALEVWRVTGSALSQLHHAHVKEAPRYEALVLGLEVERAKLYSRIEQRTELMMRLGWLEETRAALDKGYSSKLLPLEAIGYRQLCSHLAGGCTLEEAVVEIKKETRRFAKRQMTWFRKLVDHWLASTEVEAGVEISKKFLQR